MQSSTTRFMLSGLLCAVFINLPFYSYALEKDWLWATHFIFIWITNTLSAFLTFFHEIGHTIAGWFYGVPTIPMFDFKHGGGWAWQVSGQNYVLLFCVWAGLGYLWLLAREYPWLQKIIIGIFLFNIATAFNNFHLATMSFLGPAFEGLIGGFFLIRAFFDLAPRGASERFMNAFLGFAFPLNSLINGYSLLTVPSARERYFNQKDGQGAGDFDQIADKLEFISFDAGVIAWMVLTALCLILPFVFYKLAGDYSED